MTDETLLSPADLSAVRDRRASLHRACLQLRKLLSAGPAESADREALARAVSTIAQRWERHVIETEAPEGLLNQILTDAPRLATMVDRFRREHPSITAEIRVLRELLDAPIPDLVVIQHHLTTLLAAVDRHRRGGSELIHQAYNIDIGLGE
jgi:hypothetical protein